MEAFFFKLGHCIAKTPFRTIASCWTFVLVSSFGLLRFYHEKNLLNTWVPSNSQFKKDATWLMNTLETAYRPETIIMVADDVLIPEVIQSLYELDFQVRQAVSGGGYTFDDVCFRLPDMDSGLMTLNPGMSKNGVKDNDDFDPSEHFNPEIYCKLVEFMDTICYTKSILDLWQHNERKIRKLTKEDIIEKINLIKEDPILGNLNNYESLLGGIVTNATGHIIAAKALRTEWMTHLNFTAVDMNVVGNNAGTTEWATAETQDWTIEFVRIMEIATSSALTQNMSLYFSSSRSYGDISGVAIFQGLENFPIAAVVTMLYVQFVISKLNWVEYRAVLGGVGLLSVAMALISAGGLCSLVGIPFGPIHTSLPFLLMGLGVDDMFVIVACWDQLSPEQRKKPLPVRVGMMLQHAGVSITVTTATDVLAFIVGSTTVIPCLQSYCLCVAVGVLFTFIFVVTFFVACFTLDQKRLENSCNGAFPCIKYDSYVPNKFSQAETSNKAFNTIYSKIILTLPGKLCVVLFTVICFGFSIEGILNLEQKFDYRWFIPDETYMGRFIKQNDIYYPSNGYEGGVYVGGVNYTHEFMNLRHLALKIDNVSDILTHSELWVHPFREYVLKLYKKDLYEKDVNDEEFNTYLSKFLFSPKGARFQANFKFSQPIHCGKPVSKIMMTSYEFVFKPLYAPNEHVPAMQRINKISKGINLTTGDQFSMAWSIIFSAWTTDEIIETEVMRNIILALIAVMGATSLLIANVQICFWVFITILISMVNVCGLMQKWGLTINVVTCVGLQLAVGLCVDYATHIGHKFLTIAEGDRNERVLKTVTTIGSAVLYGGCATLICVAILGLSESYNFRTFFKIFTLVISFGLYNGLVLLPVILSWVGPKPYNKQKYASQTEYDGINM